MFSFFSMVFTVLFRFPQRKGSNTSLTTMHCGVTILETLKTAGRLWLLGRWEHHLILTCHIFHKTLVLLRFNITQLFSILSQTLILMCLTSSPINL